MKNLLKRYVDIFNISCNPIGLCVDEDKGTVYVLDRGGTLHSRQLKDVKSDHNRDSVEICRPQHKLDAFPCSVDLVAIEYLLESNSICIITSDGIVFLYSISDRTSRIVFKHPKHISSVSFSPDQEFLTFIDNENNLCQFGPSLELQRELSIDSCNTSQFKQVGVGWGSKETQFFGLDGRRANVKRAKTASDGDNLKSDNQDNSDPPEPISSINWRNDGQLLATMTRSEKGRHQLKVWNRVLDLLYMSDQLIDMVGHIVRWTPGGEFITCVQRHSDDCQEILFFEKNGLIHGRFELPSTHHRHQIEQIEWAGQDDLLAIKSKIVEYRGDLPDLVPQCYLFIYKSTNFSWCIKETSELATSCKLRWDRDLKTRLHMISDNGTYRLSEYTPCYHVINPNSTALVVDGKKLKATPLAICSVPPPMSALELELPGLLNSLDVTEEAMIIVTSDGHLITSHKSSPNIKSHDLKSTVFFQAAIHITSALKECYIVDISPFHRELSQFTQGPKGSIIAVESLHAGDHLVRVIPGNSEARLDCSLKRVVSYPGERIAQVNITPRAESQVNVILRSGKIDQFKLISEQEICRETSIGRSICTPFVKSCLWKTDRWDAERYITLSRDRSLHVGKQLISTFDVTSFDVTENFIVFTTADNVMRCMLLEDIDCSRELNDESKRETKPWYQNVEQGAILISADESTARVVLQMPRGNIEIIHPRILVFNLLAKLLDDRKYLDALTLAKQHRINMNAVADYHDDLFLSQEEDLTEFVLQVSQRNVDLLSLFISDLEDIDCLNGQYSSVCALVPSLRRKMVRVEVPKYGFNHNIQHQHNERVLPGKVNQICQNFILCFDRIKDKKFLNPLFMSLLKKSPPAIKDALIIIRSLENQHDSLKFIRYLISEEKLFSEALGTYDTKLALMVASVSNKDPKEYVSLINEFDQMNEQFGKKYMRYKLDLHIKRYREALENVYHCYETMQLEDEVLELIKARSLYIDAIEIFSVNSGGFPEDRPPIVNKIWDMYGRYLMGKRYFLESGLAFERARDYSSAFKSFQIEGDHNRAIACALMITPDESSQMALRTLANSLVGDSKHVIAASIYEKYCFDPEACMSALMKGRCWPELKSFFATHPSFKCQSFDDLIIDQYHDTMRSYENSLKIASSHYNRYIELMHIRATKRIELSAQDNAQVFMDVESVFESEVSELSDSSSEASRQTSSNASTLKTKKIRKENRHQDKKRNIKLTKGSRYEYLALAMALKEYILTQEMRQKDYYSLCAAISDGQLSLWQQRDYIISLTEAIGACFKFCKTIMNGLWPDNRNDPNNEISIFRILENSSGQLRDLDMDHELAKPKFVGTFQLFALMGGHDRNKVPL